MNQEQSSSEYSRRLIFSYEGERIQLLSSQREKMIALPSHPLSTDKKESGFWYEVVDKKGNNIYRRITKNPLQMEVEVRADNGKQPLMWTKNKKSKGEFVLLIPDFPEATEVVLKGTLTEEKPSREPAKELGRFSLDEKEQEQPKRKEVTKG